jgi:outer membrane protein assembly factor BamB
MKLFIPAVAACALFGCSKSVAPSTAALPVSVPTVRGTSDWPGFLGPTGDGRSPETGIPSAWPKSGPRLVWKVPIGSGYAPPSIASGLLYAFDRRGDSNRLTCRDAATGDEKWHYEYPTEYVDQYGYDGGPRCCPVIDDGRVFIFGAEGVLTCVDAASGQKVWQVDTAATFNVIQNFFGVASTPIVDGDRLIVAVGGSPQEPPPDDIRMLKSNNSAIVAFEKKTGRVLYRTGDDLASYSTPMIRTIGGKRVGLYFARRGLFGFNPETGAPAFHFPWRSSKIESVNAANPVVVNDRILLSECYSRGSALLAVGDGAPKVIWEDQEHERDHRLECHWNTPIAVDGFVYGSSGRHSEYAELRCLEMETGKVVWRRPGWTRSSLTFVDGKLLALTEIGTLLLIRATPEHYEELARIDLGPQGARMLKASCWASPVVSHGRVYIRGASELVCLDLAQP